MTPPGIEPATFRFVAQHLNHCATAVPEILYSVSVLTIRLFTLVVFFNELGFTDIIVINNAKMLHEYSLLQPVLDIIRKYKQKEEKLHLKNILLYIHTNVMSQ